MEQKEVAAVRFDKKHPFLTALAVFVVAILGVYVFSMQENHLTQEEIIALVEGDPQSLLVIAQSEAPEAMTRPRGVRKITRIDTAVDFYCGSGGKEESAAYCGFYYRPDGAPDAVYCGARFGLAEELQPEGDGFVIRREDRTYYTRHITDGFYYYEVRM